MLVSLIIPTLNESDAIVILLQKLDSVSKSLTVQGNSLEVIIVDDGSADGTRDIIKNVQSKFFYKIILRERQVKDLATAVIDGFKLANGEIWGVMDADLSHPPEMLPLMVEALKDADISVGSRNILGGGVENWPYHRKFTSRFGALLTRAINIKITDPMSGFFFLRRSVLENVTLSPIGYKVLLEILIKGHYQNLVEVPYLFLNRTVGKSNMGSLVMINYLRHLWRLLLWKIKH